MFFFHGKNRCIRFGMNFWDQSQDFHEENMWDELLGEEKHHKDLGESPKKIWCKIKYGVFSRSSFF